MVVSAALAESAFSKCEQVSASAGVEIHSFADFIVLTSDLMFILGTHWFLWMGFSRVWLLTVLARKIDIRSICGLFLFLCFTRYRFGSFGFILHFFF